MKVGSEGIESNTSHLARERPRAGVRQDRAACRGVGHREFVISRRGEASRGRGALCDRCSVSEEVADASVIGVWGGSSGKERRA